MNGSYSRLQWLAVIVLALLQTGTSQAKEIDWARINPELTEATSVADDSTCIDCHEDYMQTYAGTRHGRTNVSCESCHGPASKHLEDRRKKPIPLISFSADSVLTSPQKSSVCLQCHEGTSRTYWQGNVHEASDASCDSCHYVMERKSDTALIINENATGLCVSCHLEKKGQILKSSHMPIRQGKIDCTDCHNPHGSYGPSLLKAATTNEVCSECHAEKRGPFLFEHAPVREDCGTCHDPHGSNNPGMLTNKGSFLCLSCHQYGGHVNLPRYNRVNSTVGQGCVNCHNRIHGSNHPSGSKLTR